MATTLSNLNTIINDRRRDTGSNTVSMTGNGFRAINSALEIWSNSHDWPWQIKEATFNYNDGITKYAISSIASDFKYDITLRPYKNVSKLYEFDKVSMTKFYSATTRPRRYAYDVSGLSQYLLVKHTSGGSATIEALTDYDGNGTWVGGSAISNVANDSYESFDLSGSISFDYSGTSGTLTNSTFTAVDLTPYNNRSNLYVNVYFPTVTSITSVSLKWGSSASDYYTSTQTTDYLGNAFVAGWNKVKFPWSSPTTVGTPDVTAIDYAQITIAYSVNPSATGFRVENLFISENIPLTLTYYSVNMVYDVSGATQLQEFNDSAATTDYPLWSGRWDSATEPFVNSVLEIIFWLTGEQTDQAKAEQRVLNIVNTYKVKYPSQRRYPTMSMVADVNTR